MPMLLLFHAVAIMSQSNNSRWDPNLLAKGRYNKWVTMETMLTPDYTNRLAVYDEMVGVTFMV